MTKRTDLPLSDEEPPTLDELMELHGDDLGVATEGDPFASADPEAVTAGYAVIMVKHLRLTLRDDNDKVIADGGDLASMTVGSLIAQVRAMGYDVDNEWLLQSLAKNLPS